MLTAVLQTLFIRDLTKLRTELTLYKNQAAIWHTDKAIANSAGNLCLHLVGNLKTYIGSVMGKTGYIRKRDLEFSLKDISLQELLQQIDETIQVIEQTLPGITEEQLQEQFPMRVFENSTTTQYMLVHLATHLGYHLGQVNYHRRLLDY